MTSRYFSGVFLAEGSSDMPIAELVEGMFFERGFEVHLSKPDFDLLSRRVGRDVGSKIRAAKELTRGAIDVLVVHRDADSAGAATRRAEIVGAAADALGREHYLVPVIPVRMTEAWLLLDEAAIRTVAGNPRGRTALSLPRRHEVETCADPKKILEECLLAAADATGRRRDRVAKRFSQSRKQLLERLDLNGPVTALPSWRSMVAEIDSVVEQWRGDA